MPLYTMPTRDPYQRLFYIGAAVVVVLLLGVLFISVQSERLASFNLHAIGWTAMAIVVAAVVGAQVLSVMGSGWQAKQRLTIELADGKLIQRRDGSVVAEMPVTEIQSLQQGWGWLVAKSGEKVITIPVQVVGYSQLRHELSAHAAITPLRLPGFLLALLQFGLTTAAWALLAFSHRRMVIEVSGIAALVFLTWGAFMARRRLRSKRAPVFLALCYGWSMVVTVWFIFVRLKAVP